MPNLQILRDPRPEEEEAVGVTHTGTAVYRRSVGAE